MGRRERGRAGHSTDGREAKERPRQNAGAIFEQAGNKENGGCTPAPPRWLDRLLGDCAWGWRVGERGRFGGLGREIRAITGFHQQIVYNNS